MIGNLFFAVFGAVMGAVVAGYIVPVHIKPQPSPAPIAQPMEQATPEPDDVTMSRDEMISELEGLEGSAFDAVFLELMIENHRTAIEMAEAAQLQAAQAEITDLAESIIETQTTEVEQMQSWQTTLVDEEATAAAELE